MPFSGPCPGKKNRQYFGHNFDKFKYIVVIFCKEYREECETTNTTKVRISGVFRGDGIAVSSPRLRKGRSVYRPTVGVEGDCAEAYTESTVINSEYILWRQQWTATAAEQRPDAATAALSSCNSVKFPNVSTDCCPS